MPAGGCDSEEYVLPDLTKVRITINGLPNMLYNEGIVSTDLRAEASRFFVKKRRKQETLI